jgi:hypothetical protein
MMFVRHAMLLLLLLCGAAWAAAFTYPTLPATGKTVEAFVPEGWHVLTITQGALNGDKLADRAMVIEANSDLNAKNAPEPPCDCATPRGRAASPPPHHPRMLLLLLEEKGGGYRLSGQSRDLILCADEGGAFGDPFAGIAIERGAVVVRFYGGSNWRWEITARFRLEKTRWQLIGHTDLSYHTSSTQMTEYDYNLLTGKLKTTTGHRFETKRRTIAWSTPGKQTVALEAYRAWFDTNWPKVTGGQK